MEIIGSGRVPYCTHNEYGGNQGVNRPYFILSSDVVHFCCLSGTLPSRNVVADGYNVCCLTKAASAQYGQASYGGEYSPPATPTSAYRSPSYGGYPSVSTPSSSYQSPSYALPPASVQTYQNPTHGIYGGPAPMAPAPIYQGVPVIPASTRGSPSYGYYASPAMPASAYPSPSYGSSMQSPHSGNNNSNNSNSNEKKIRLPVFNQYVSNIFFGNGGMVVGTIAGNSGMGGSAMATSAQSATLMSLFGANGFSIGSNGNVVVNPAGGIGNNGNGNSGVGGSNGGYNGGGNGGNGGNGNGGAESLTKEGYGLRESAVSGVWKRIGSEACNKLPSKIERRQPWTPPIRTLFAFAVFSA
ncbi:hypothetical protein RvY_04522 [Ramazzottius varieornatus]|uniref:Uncharacterized protein n=1 Tax=Ramazzottius varieornatus TaxID=947166 RepID=A0A1D1URY7_RAMVA|nr:hypothetical protein RvY_04522 [Ramazzottius varieornatus]